MWPELVVILRVSHTPLDASTLSPRAGYHLVVPMAQRQTAVDAGFIRLASQTSKKTFACSTAKMVQLNTRAHGMIDQILATTETVPRVILLPSPPPPTASPSMCAPTKRPRYVPVCPPQELGDLLHSIRQEINALFRLSESIAMCAEVAARLDAGSA